MLLGFNPQYPHYPQEPKSTEITGQDKLAGLYMTDWRGNNPNINNPYLLISNYIKPPLALRRLTKERGKRNPFSGAKKPYLTSVSIMWYN